MKLNDHIVYEDDQLVAINKPAGMLSIQDRAGNPALKNLLQDKYGEIFTVHRLDKDTSGMIVFAKNETAHRQLSMLFEGRDVAKYYVGLVVGKPPYESGTVDIGLLEHPVRKGMMVANRKGKTSITDYEMLESFRQYTWMQFRIHTGRMHQIRVHMKDIGCPLVCDELYGDAKPVFLSGIKTKYNLSKEELEERPLLARLALHSYKLSFTLSGKEYNLEAEPPKDIRATLQQLRKNK
ncbi:23S rRNA pseudouridine955/2504/2580 synthase/23S rRNA pseudouridine1911/1915/1917 synthase [Cnuella takakiae]|uniref:23S rRNA pseudouridine955/2504/2580 synthase/23S rRNA pseudouridine1911/1915/1917 synthase n=1 Tax=Cnuella takakiae TaxID=1302690 RepID=A0A1M4X6J4_9BACT|nr:RluA family pseudouridine synthase [Cnuella takakiae]OLY91525.1 RNA pseudouridine synthase [Cnuella takakiae]SHE88752.1 23S rRNA pseudouridine955/2504/2580 synthase/23S rRNA pseudouridine1911/1915/1917 synthase [Cnuella takakiae]